MDKAFLKKQTVTLKRNDFYELTMRKTAKFFIFAIVLSSCTTEVGSNNWFSTATDLEIKRYLQFSCEGYGFKKDTDAMRECIQREANAQKERAATSGRLNEPRIGITLRGRL